ncbi:MAG: hypothetical protein ACKOAH_25430, partial [Pirellula sp.]
MTKARGTFFGSIVGGQENAVSAVKVQGIEKTPLSLDFSEIERIEFPVAELPPNDVTSVELSNGMRYATNRLESRMDESFSGVEIELTGKKLQIPLTQIKRISKRPVASLEDPTSTAGTQTEKSVVQRLI